MGVVAGPRTRMPLVIAVIVGLIAVVVTYVVLRRDPGEAGADKRAGCEPIEVSSSTEKADLMIELARRYNASDTLYGGKRCASVTVHRLTSGAAAEALGSGWDEQRDGGPAPQVWTPTASLWLQLARHRETTGGKQVVPAAGTQMPSIAQSPLVISMPKPMAEAFGWPNREFGWSDVLALASDPQGWGRYGHPEWGRFSFGKDNPHRSTSGFAATVATYYAATGLSRELTAADLTQPNVINFVRGVEAGVLHYTDDAVKFLANLAEADAKGAAMSYVSAVVHQEQLTFLYNKGNTTGDPKVKGRAPTVPLVPMVPRDGTLMLDHPYVVLPSASDAQREAAADFLAFLQQPAQQAAFAAMGFRDHQGNAGPELAQTLRIPAGQQLSLIQSPVGEVLDKILAGWDDLRKKARVLLVLDVSGSMKEKAAGDISKLEAAKNAAIASLDLLHPDDEVALWTFSGQRPNGAQPYTERLPMSRIRDAKQQLTDIIRALSADGGTALYHTTRAADVYMRGRLDADRINAVVLLTDGRNEYPADNDRAKLLRDLDGSRLENSIRIFGIAFGEEADLDTLEQIAKVSRAAAYDARDPASVDKIFSSVLSNF
ncbi:extracellular solute-binding protein [Dactylosporangium sp. NPDC050688]|uniref:extracellular solute-binding protein n=1 Tax=Dactylosporangium sp. NPDC050688 TaxID=3157217 RepID=UPI0033E97A38